MSNSSSERDTDLVDSECASKAIQRYDPTRGKANQKKKGSRDEGRSPQSLMHLL